MLPDDLKYWRHILRKTESLLDYYGFEKIETPIVENADLYRRTFENDENIDKKIVSIKNKEETLALRYDYNAAIARAFVANGMNSWPHPLQHVDEIPEGFKAEYWNPSLREDAKEISIDKIREGEKVYDQKR